MVDNDDKLLQIDRIRHFDGNEEYMMERENRDLGARFMDYLRSQDTPVVVELKVDVFPDIRIYSTQPLRRKGCIICGEPYDGIIHYRTFEFPSPP